MTTPQIPLGVELPQTATFNAFVGSTNAGARAAVCNAVTERGGQIYLHGPHATGKTHLLQAVCRAVAETGQRSAYVPLAQLGRDVSGLVAGMHTLDCLCLDDIGAIAGDRDAEIALVGLIDGVRVHGGRLLLTACYPADELPLALGDLASRLDWGGVYALAEPDDADKEQLLMQRAAQRGMQLPAATARYLLRHGTRDVPGLMAMLAQLDTASLAAQRRLTIPFVKQALGHRPRSPGG